MCRIALALFVPFKGIVHGLVFVIDVILGENTHTHFVKGRTFECAQRLLFQFIPLVCPGVIGCSKGVKRGAISVAKVVEAIDAHRLVIRLGRLHTGELALLPI
jgi:hypothetical protein